MNTKQAVKARPARTAQRAVKAPVKSTTSAPERNVESKAVQVYDPLEMEAAAIAAAAELPRCKTAEDLACWLRAHYLKAGYKRLNRAIFKHFGLNGKVKEQ